MSPFNLPSGWGNQQLTILSLDRDRARFQRRWHLPHALGPIDGKHICTREERSNVFQSMVPLGLVGVDYMFTWLDIAATGSSSDSQIFLYRDLRRKVEDNVICFPQAETLVDHGSQVEYFIVGNDASPSEPG